MRGTAIITGVTGQLGSFMADRLTNTGYRVIGVTRKHGFYPDYIQNLLYYYPNFEIEIGQITDRDYVSYLFDGYKPDYFYNFAGVSSVRYAELNPTSCYEINSYALINIFEKATNCKIFNAGSSEEFGEPITTLQGINHPRKPRNVYGLSKLMAHDITEYYRKYRDKWAVQHILYNSESNRRSTAFVTGKIIQFFRHYSVSYPKLKLGCLESKRDWIHASDTVSAIYKAMRQDKPKDYIIGRGDPRTIREFVETAAGIAELNGKIEDYVEESTEFFVKPEFNHFRADISETTKNLSWVPEMNFKQIVNSMF